MTYVEIRPLGRELRVPEVIRVKPEYNRTGVPTGRGRDGREFSMHTQRRGHVRTHKTAICKPGGESSPENKFSGSLISDF